MKRILSAMLAVLCFAPAAAQTWTQLAAPGPPGPRNLLGCWFDGADPNHGVATGFYVQAFDLIPFVYTTVNGGSSWQYQTPYFAGSFLAARAVTFTGSLNGFLVGGGVARTEDGGTTWDLRADVFNVGGQLSDVTFSSPTARLGGRRAVERRRRPALHHGQLGRDMDLRQHRRSRSAGGGGATAHLRGPSLRNAAGRRRSRERPG